MSGTDDDHNALKNDVLGELRRAGQSLLSLEPSSDPRIASKFEMLCVEQIKKLWRPVESLRLEQQRQIKEMQETVDNDREALRVEREEHNSTKTALKIAYGQVQQWQKYFEMKQRTAIELQRRLHNNENSHMHDTSTSLSQLLGHLKKYVSDKLAPLSEDRIGMLLATLAVSNSGQQENINALVDLNRSTRVVLRTHELVNTALSTVLEIEKQAFAAVEAVRRSECKDHTRTKQELKDKETELQVHKDENKRQEEELRAEKALCDKIKTSLLEMQADDLSDYDSADENFASVRGSGSKAKQLSTTQSLLKIEEEAHQATRDMLETERKSHQKTRELLSLAQRNTYDTALNSFGSSTANTITGVDSDSNGRSVPGIGNGNKVDLVDVIKNYYNGEERIQTLEVQLEDERLAHQRTKLEVQILDRKNSNPSELLRNELDTERTRVQSLKTTLKFVEAEVERVEKEYSKLLQDLNTAHNTIKLKDAQLGIERKELENQKERVCSLEQALTSEKLIHNITKGNLKNIRNKLREEQDEHKETRAELDSKILSLQHQNAALDIMKSNLDKRKGQSVFEGTSYDTTSKRARRGANLVNSDAVTRFSQGAGQGQSQEPDEQVEAMGALFNDVQISRCDDAS